MAGGIDHGLRARFGFQQSLQLIVHLLAPFSDFSQAQV
jgi:hypothetical protein